VSSPNGCNVCVRAWAAGVPVVFGVLTCDTMEQVRARKLAMAQWLAGAACMLGLG